MSKAHEHHRESLQQQSDNTPTRTGVMNSSCRVSIRRAEDLSGDLALSFLMNFRSVASVFAAGEHDTGAH